ncbi:serine carboxypeptidase-like 13 [Prunus dulcis]|uniref:Serine carboxypeptidase-like 13 n=1 Tax=Prunus dulcis TaxID=3755 RepID=A0A4Y1S064_PRUDU|nr:serine carboxypeptidase-like 13 [Prunus dulcis]
MNEPVGTGFSYAKSWEGYSNISDTLSAVQTYEFLRKWLMDHPKFYNNPLYIAGDSYSGITLPIVVQEISDGNRDEHLPPMNLKSMKRNCKGEYVNVDLNNTLCVDDLEVFNKCIEDIHLEQILEPVCSVSSPKSAGSKWFAEDLVNKDSANLLLSFPQLRRPWCRSYNYLFSYIWANDRTVQDALHIREGSSIKEWERCNKTLQDLYISDVSSSLVYHENLIKQGYRVLIDSGDHDMNIPYVSTMGWIESLNLTVDSHWKPWFLHGQVAGLVSSISSSFLLCIEFSQKIRLQPSHSCAFFVRFRYRGAGHTAPEYKPEECLAMINRNLNPITVLNVATEAALEFRAISLVPAASETKTSTGKMLAGHLPSLGLLRLISMGLGRLQTAWLG